MAETDWKGPLITDEEKGIAPQWAEEIMEGSAEWADQDSIMVSVREKYSCREYLNT